VKIYFVTKNRYKIDELRGYLEHFKVREHLSFDLRTVERAVQEILHRDINVIVRRKALEAYEDLGVPCVVEHGGLFMDALPGLPGGIGQLMWDAVGDRMCGFLNPDDSRRAVARSVIGYCDGRQIWTYGGETWGHVTEARRGEYAFNWDPIFVPDECEETYGEMGPEKKRATSPAVKAWDAFLSAQFPGEWPPPRA